jgi:hypothetical protein
MPSFLSRVLLINTKQIYMLRQIFFLTLIFSATFLITHAQNTSPYWSLLGNSNASATSKLGTTNSIPLNLITNNATRIKIYENGRVGVGASITNTNATRVLNLTDANAVMRILRVHASNAPAVELISRTSADGPNVAYWDMYAEPSDKSFRIRDRQTGANLDRLTINHNGFVGIGTTSPDLPLVVEGRIRLRSSGGGTAGLWLNNLANTTAIGFMGASDDNHIGLWANLGGFWGLTMNTTNGNVGIGTSADYPLHVSNGTAHTVIFAKSTAGGSGTAAIRGEALNVNSYGVEGTGGQIGVYGINPGGGSAGETYGVLGYSSGTAGTRMGVRGYAEGGANVYGVYGYAAKGSFNAAGYFSGNVYANGILLTSDRKFKSDILPLGNALQQVMKLRPASYQFKTAEYQGMNFPKGRQLGLIADEVQTVFPELVQRAVHPAVYEENDRTKVLSPEVEYEGVNYQGLIPVLVASVQELKAENDELKTRLQKLETLLNAKGNATDLNPSIAFLGQNIPNPSKSFTTIQYGVPDGTTSARLILINAKGQTLKEVNIGGKGNGQVNLNIAALPAGMYRYSLFINGREADSKQMVITK